MQSAYEFIKSQQGISPASSYSYIGYQNLVCKFNSSNKLANVTDYIEVMSGNETLLRDALAFLGPLAVAVDASLLTFQNYKSGVFDDTRCTGIQNHAGSVSCFLIFKFIF